VDETERYVVVAKLGVAGEMAMKLDPRIPGREQRTRKSVSVQPAEQRALNEADEKRGANSTRH
jgi:hypothetical protein